MCVYLCLPCHIFSNGFQHATHTVFSVEEKKKKKKRKEKKSDIDGLCS